MTRWIPLAILLAVGAAASMGCDDGSAPAGPDGPPEGLQPIPDQWAGAVTNAFFPLVPGTTWTYQGQTEDGLETITVEVLTEVEVIQGVQATVVRDRVFLDGELIEDTFDWYAQDAAGNVWYLGEQSEELEAGEVVSTEGSWQWGVDGALPGIIMWADPAAHVGEEYRQEFYPGEAEDWGKVIAVGQSITVPFGSFDGCIVTEDWDALEPGTREEKTYCPDVGTVLEIEVEGGDERVELIDRTS